MAGRDGGTDAGPSEGRGSLSTSQLPWGQIPSFVAGESDLEDYAKKLIFLRSIWPEEHIAHLAPRAALQCDAVSFKKVSKIDPERLKSKEGCDALLTALGVQWGRFQNEDRYLKFERALFLTTQKPDESNDSYIARHEASFEEILQKDKSVSLEEIRAYVMIRHSQLTGEEKKRIIVDNKGILTYDSTRDAMRLLGSRFFQDLQGAGGKKWKTYDAHTVEESEPVFTSVDEGVDEEQVYQTLLEQGDEDAVFIQEFDEQIIEAVQDSGELASCFLSYQEARAKLRERARNRGFWPPRGSGKGKSFGGGKKGGKGAPFSSSRRTLAERIANSTCRICGKPGHWKRECPQRPDRPDRPSEMATMAEEFEEFNDPELPENLPDEIQESSKFRAACLFNKEKTRSLLSSEALGDSMMHWGPHAVDHVQECFAVFGEVREMMSRALKQHARLRGDLMKRREAGTHEAKGLSQTFSVKPSVAFASTPSVEMNQEEGVGEAILDTGASRTVIGSERVPALERALRGIRIERGPSKCVFRFGNSGLLRSEEALFLKRHGKGWLRVEIVPGSTPFLISNAVVEGLKGVVDVHQGLLSFHGSDDVIHLRRVRKKLCCLKVRDLLNVRFFEAGESCLHVHTKKTTQTDIHTHPDVHEEFEHTTPDGRKEDGTSQQTTDLIQSSAEPPISREIHAASGANQASSTESVFESVKHHGPTQDGASIPVGRAVRGGGLQSSTGDSSASHLPVQGAPWNSQPPAMGSRVFPVRKAQGGILPRHLRQGEQLCAVHPEQYSADGNRHAQLSEFLQSSEKEVGTDDAAGSHSSEDNVSSPFCNELRSNQLDPRAPGASSDHRLGVEPCGDERAAFPSQEHQGQSEKGVSTGKFTNTDEGGGEFPDRAGAPDADCDSPEGTGEADISQRRPTNHTLRRQLRGVTNARSPKWNTEEVNRRCKELICTIEDGLSTLPKKFVGTESKPQTGVSDPGHNRPIDCLEVYCFADSQLTKQIESLGGKAVRFTRKDGDLTTPEGVKKLWTWIMLYEPTHIWASPDCKYWGGFSRLNMSRNEYMERHIMEKRQTEKPNLNLCHDLYWHQVCLGRHFHLEQPSGSEMIQQSEMYDIATGTMPASFDQCRVGGLRLPQDDRFLRKRTVVHTTSRIVHSLLHRRWCNQDHEHRRIEGSFKHHGDRQSVSAFAAHYTRTFARTVTKALMESSSKREDPLAVMELLAGFEASESGHKRSRESAIDSLRLKRHRCVYKQPCPAAFAPAVAPVSWEHIMQEVSKETPRVGVHTIRQGPLMEKVQSVIPEMQVQLMISCRGTDRYRTPDKQDDSSRLTLRKTVYIHRVSGAFVDVGVPEEWQKLSRMKRVGKCGPARLSLTVFGSPCFGEEIVDPHPKKETREGSSPAISVEGHESAWAPRPIAVSGPLFLKLPPEERADIVRLHQNLGHPEPDLFRKFLKERGASEAVIEGVKEFQCPTCAENQGAPLLARPSSIHRDLDFNDEVGGDGAWWTNSRGRKFHFMHFIDEGTLFHVGAPCGRSTPEQIRVFEDVWLQWAGPCKLLYLDPAGEYVNDEWRQFLQTENICVSLSAGESHWQLGRCERHGQIAKNMLDRMNVESPIESDEEFRVCLRQAFAAKNALSRVGGFLPGASSTGKVTTHSCLLDGR